MTEHEVAETPNPIETLTEAAAALGETLTEAAAALGDAVIGVFRRWADDLRARRIVAEWADADPDAVKPKGAVAAYVRRLEADIERLKADR